jgi:hypothetical protein
VGNAMKLSQWKKMFDQTHTMQGRLLLISFLEKDASINKDTTLQDLPTTWRDIAMSALKRNKYAQN